MLTTPPCRHSSNRLLPRENESVCSYPGKPDRGAAVVIGGTEGTGDVSPRPRWCSFNVPPGNKRSPALPSGCWTISTSPSSRCVRFARTCRGLLPTVTQAGRWPTGELWALPIMLRLSILAALAQAVEQVTNLPQQVADPLQRRELPSRPLSGSLAADEIVPTASPACAPSAPTTGRISSRA
jgi:hypothetical protein